MPTILKTHPIAELAEMLKPFGVDIAEHDKTGNAFGCDERAWENAG